ncbi:MAG: hypothetical protein QOD30_1693, partial [Actinomycetota bacterium]|nr:hypothetical protein [Actinomycetota bacterium]
LRTAHESVRNALDVAVLDVEAAEMRASDVLARVKPLDVPAAPAEPEPAAADVADEPAVEEIVAEVVETPASDEASAAEPSADETDLPSDEAPSAEARPEERRSSALRLLRSRTDVETAPAAPPVDDPYEGVRIIRPEVAPEPAPDDDAAAESAPPAIVGEEVGAVDETAVDGETAAPETAAVDAPPALSLVADDPVVEAPAVEVVDEVIDLADDAPTEDAAVDAVAADETQSGDEAPVDDLFARLRADRAATLAKATAVLAATDASPSAPPEAEMATPPVEDADASSDRTVLTARDSAVADAERVVVRSLKRALADEQNEVLDALRRLRGAPTVEALLPDIAVHEARYDAVLGTGATAAASAGGELAGGGGDAGTVTAEIGRSLATDLRARVARSIDDAAGDVETLAEAISATYREWKTSRAEPLARDVIAAAFASGTYVAASGSLRWVVDPAEGGCPDCEDNALAGETPKGTAYPTGQVRPPAHAGCRCALVPVS